MNTIKQETASKVATELRGISNQELVIPINGFPSMAVNKLIKEVEGLTDIGKAFIPGWIKASSLLKK
ncbi:MAG: hypothetical protein JWM92_400 [Candidatus Nomurabacteria bacterium]|jgi:hypothetical protein|nr:hypothetical protein [Candidatus Nomurabacteria bacterium]